MLDEWISAFRAADERFERVWTPDGHLLGQVGGVLTAPFEPVGEMPPCQAKPARWPLPSAVVSEGRFLDDEWVYDPSLAGRVIAAGPQTLAVTVASHLAAGHGKAVLCVTDRRIAVIIQERHTGVAEEKSLLSRFRKNETDEDTGKRPVVWWQEGRAAVRDLPEVRYGRELEKPVRFRAVVFADGSALELSRSDDW